MQSIPNIIIPIIENGTSSNKNLRDELQDKRVIIFGVPGAFTPTCSEKHLPGFITLYDRIKSNNIADIYCLSVNDAFVMKAWEKDQNAKGKVTLLSDGNGDYSSALGLSFDGSKFGLGTRGQRFAMIIDNCVVTHLAIEEAGDFKLSSVESILEILKKH